MTSYKILLKKEPEGGYTGCVTYGESIEETIELVKEAIELYIESLKAYNEGIPKTSPSGLSESYKNTGKKRICIG
jgi:predicted RNase H-like HicB family nuclease